MFTVITDQEAVVIPAWVNSLETFRRWSDQDDFPRTGSTWWLRGEVWVDMSKEQVFSHILVKTEIAAVLRTLTKAERPGLFLTDGLLLSNFAADISGNPDSTFLSNDTLQSDRVRLIEGAESGYTEIQGSPDMVLEVLSTSSVRKDTEVLRAAYWEAGIREYWLVDARKDARKDALHFDILRHTAKGYVPTRKHQGWLKSVVFGKSFRLLRTTNTLGHPEYTLEVR